MVDTRAVNDGGVNFIEDLFTYHADFRFGWIYQAARRVVLEIGLVISQGAQTICLKFVNLPQLLWFVVLVAVNGEFW